MYHVLDKSVHNAKQELLLHANYSQPYNCVHQICHYQNMYAEVILPININKYEKSFNAALNEANISLHIIFYMIQHFQQNLIKA